LSSASTFLFIDIFFEPFKLLQASILIEERGYKFLCSPNFFLQ
jgi:hypothetical protein